MVFLSQSHTQGLPPLAPSQQRGKGDKGEEEEEDDEDDDVAALERRMKEQGMPANVWRHVRREIR